MCKYSFGDVFVLLCSPDYNVEFFRQFILVMNALDNRGKVHLILLASQYFLCIVSKLYRNSTKIFPNELELESPKRK
jgi:hypothetical protein